MSAFTKQDLFEDKNPRDSDSAKAGGWFTNVRCTAQIDSKGRITIPSRIRGRLSLEPGDRLEIGISTSRVVKIGAGTREEALEFIQSFDSVKSFSYDSGAVEVILDEQI